MARDFSRYTSTPNLPGLRLIKAQDPSEGREAILRDPFGVLDNIQWDPMDLAYLSPEGADNFECENPF